MKRKVKASSLQLVTFIIVVIALLLSSFLILMHVHKQFRIQTDYLIETVRLSDQGIQYSLSNTIKTNDTIDIDLHDEDYKSLKIEKSFWGVFEKVYAESRIKNKTFYKIALIGHKEQGQKTALFLKDNGKPLVVVGKTRIEGLSYLPKRGIKSGNIAGHSYYGTTFIKGKTELSKGFPSFSDEITTHVKSLIKSLSSQDDNTVFLDLNTTKKRANSFNEPLLMAFSNRDIELSEKELTGHIIVQSDTKITIDETSQLNDVILIAPEVEIRKNVNGAFQVFATERISVSENVILQYPSVLALYGDYEKQDINQDHFIAISSNSKIKGSVLCLGKTTADNYDIQIKIDKNAEIEGEVYCEQNLELRGRVYGTVYTNNFNVKEGGTTYQNHLYNGEINVNELTEQYVGLVFDNSSKEIVKWLY